VWTAATVVKWARRWRDTGTWAPHPQGGDKRSERIEAYGAQIVGLIAEKADMTPSICNASTAGVCAEHNLALP